MVFPKISVIVPVYNSEKYIRRCVDSILAQSFSDFELLLIDDGSLDRSGKICDEYAEIDSRIRVFHKSNGGVSSARNVGLDNAQGEWVTFVDSDDFVYDSYLDNYDVYNNVGFDLITQGLRIDKEFDGCSEFKFSFVGKRNNWLNEATRNGTFGYCVIKLFKLEIIRTHNISFNTEICFQEDELFVLSYLSACNSIKSVLKVGYFYFVPDWGKYIGGDVESKLRRTQLMINVLHNNFDRPDELLIYKMKKNSLLLYYIEGNLRHLNRSYLKALRELVEEGYQIPHIPKVISKLIAIDRTCVISTVIITTIKVYSKLTKRKIEYI